MSRHNIYKGGNRKISAFFLHYSEIMLKFAAEQMYNHLKHIMPMG